MAIRLTGLASGLDTDSMVKELVSAYSKKKESIEKKKTKLEWKQEALSSMNTKIYGFYTGALSSMRMSSSFTSKKTVSVSDPNKVSVTAGGSVANGTQTVEIKQMAQAGYLTSTRLADTSGKAPTSKTTFAELGIENSGEFSVVINGESKSINYSSTDTIGDFLTKIKEETGLTASYDSNNQRLIISSKSGKENDFIISSQSEGGLKDLAKLGLLTKESISTYTDYLNLKDHDEAGDKYNIDDVAKSLKVTDYASKQAATNSIIIVNGAEYESSSNTITVNGLTVDAKGVTDGPISVTTSTDVDGIYNMIKDFVKEYNTIINEMTKSFNAKSAKGYEPLTEDEKDEMSEKEVEKWETKIKDSILRRDESLNSILSALTSGIQKGITINGKSYNLSSFGIQTQSIMSSKADEYNALHIAGDKDDSISADSKDKLKEAISRDPDVVMEFFNTLTKDVYSSLTEKMKSTTLRSAYTVYNDKQMKEDVRKLETEIANWDKKISNYEEKWYKQFSKMESALSTLQNQTNSLTSLLGS